MAEDQEQQRTTIFAFKGLRQNNEAHLVNATDEDGMASMADARNVRTETGALKTRRGFSFIRRWTHGTWPLLLFSRFYPGPKNTDGDDREDNDGITADTGAIPQLMQPLGGSSETPLSSLWRSGDAMPDYAQLGARLFLANGRDVPLAVDKDRQIRALGAQGQRGDLTLEELSTGSLTPGQAYFYAVTRMIIKGEMKIESPAMTASITLSDSGTSVGVGGIQQYEYSLPSDYTVHYRIYRTTTDTTQAAYLVTELDSFPPGGEYLDEKSDSGLDMTYSYSMVEQSPDYPMPPCSFIRAHLGGLVCAGSRVSEVSVDTTGGSADIAANGCSVREADVGGTMKIAGEGEFRVVDVDMVNEVWTLNDTLAASNTDVQALLQHAVDVIYQSNRMPGNIEGYTPGTEVYSNAESGNPVTGLATAGNVCYVMRSAGVEILEGFGQDAQLAGMPDNPPGCVAAATIADRYSQRIFYYAGRAGVWEIAGNRARHISLPVQKTIDEEALHDYDAWTHAVYDPVNALYHLWLFKSGDVQGDPVTYRVPSLLLTYDVRRERWYKGELAASASGVWLDNGDNPYAVVGVKNGTARLEQGTADGDTAKVITVDDNSGATLYMRGTVPDQAEGQSAVLLYGDGTTEYRTVVDQPADAWVTLNAAPSYSVTGAKVSIGGIRWLAQFGEMELPPALEYTKKFTSLDVIHDPQQNEIDVRISGVREHADRTRTKTLNLADRSRQKVKANDMGLRGRSAEIALSGVTTNEIRILGLVLESHYVKQ